MWSRKRLIVAGAAALAVLLVGVGVWGFAVSGLRVQVTASKTSASAGPTVSSSPSAFSSPTDFSSPTATSTALGFGRSSPTPCPNTSVLAASPADPNDPSPRYNAALAYDAVRKQLVLFGGDSRGGALGDTWIWNGSSWRQQHPMITPPPRAYAQMTFDAAHAVVVLFGGGPSAPMDDTWTWDGTNWTEQHPALRPPGTYESAMDYDAVIGQVVLVAQSMGSPPQTWAWDGTTWHQLHPAVNPRNQSTAMAYDPGARQMILAASDGTWTFDGVTWSQAPAAAPTGSLANMSYDAATSSMLLFANGGPTATYTWDGAAWTQRCPPASPPWLTSTGPMPAMAYDAAAGLVIVFGGVLPSNEASSATWTWDGTTWAQWHAKS